LDVLNPTLPPSANHGKSGIPLYPAIGAIIEHQQYIPPGETTIHYNAIYSREIPEIAMVPRNYYSALPVIYVRL